MLRQAFEVELLGARQAQARGDRETAWRHLERAHVLSQHRTRLHVRAHWAMLLAACGIADAREIAGQISRLIGAALFSRIWVPEGNTGGANVSAFKRMPIPDDLAMVIRSSTALADRKRKRFPIDRDPG